MAGAVDSLIGALALGGVVYALLLQQKELAIQRKELVLTREQMIEQTKINSARLEMELASVVPILRFDGFLERQVSSYPQEGAWGDGWLILKGKNVGGPLRHADCRVWYGKGDFAELFPRDQDEDAYLTAGGDPEQDSERSVDSGGVFSLRLYFRIPTGVDIDVTSSTFSATLILQYVNAFNQLRYSEYYVRLRDEGARKTGQFILLRDLPPAEAFKARLLESHPGFSRREMPTLTIESLYARE